MPKPISSRSCGATWRRASGARVSSPRAMGALYLAAGMFALATMLSIIGAVLAHLGQPVALGVDILAAATAGAIGFAAFVIAALALIEESRLALRALTLEARETELRLAGRGTPTTPP